MLIYSAQNTAGQDLDSLAGKIADRKAYFAILAAGGAVIMFDRTGARISAETDGQAAGITLRDVIDAVDVWPDMSRKAITAAHKKAAMREGLRRAEKRADYLIPRVKAGQATDAERLELLYLVNVAYHDSGKIEGIYSIDSTAACEFCERMRAAAVDNILMICGACYAAADAWKEAAWRHHKLNARILSEVLFTREELSTLAIGARLRFNEDGDTVNATMARNYLRIATTHPATFCGYWYKNGPAVAEGLAAEGYRTRADLPANVRFIHSSALIGFPAAPLWFDDCIFTVYPDAETTAAAIAAGAWPCNGRKCSACGFMCYMHKRQAEPVHIAEYLRTGKANRARIRAAYDARKAAA